MPTPLAFLSSGSDLETERWITSLSAALKGERLVDFRTLSTAQKKMVEIAIVAGPDPADLRDLPNLKWIHSLWAGVEKMMAELAEEPFEIVRLEDPEMALKMSEAVLSWVLYLHRDMPTYRKQQEKRLWHELEHSRAFHRHIGFIGLGNLGAEAAKMLRGLGFDVSGWSRSPKTLAGIQTYHGEDGLLKMLGTVDIVVLLVPLTKATTGLINAATIKAMKPGAGLINFARGPIIDVPALLAGLESGQISHAVLDVFEKEPLPDDSPLWSHDAITILPHISGPTDRETASAIVAKNIAHYRKTGKLPKTVDKVRGY